MKKFNSGFMSNFTAIIGAIATLLGMMKIDEVYVQVTLLLIFIILIIYVIFSFLRNRNNKSYTYLLGRWNAYHITKDSSREESTYWQQGKAIIEKINSSWEIRIIQYDLNDADDQYLMTGSVSKGRIFLLAENVNPHFRDSYTAYFHNLQKGKTLIGYWMGENLDQNPTIAPYILSKDKLDIKSLNKLAKLDKINFFETSENIKEAKTLISK